MKSRITTLSDIRDRCVIDERGCWLWKSGTTNAGTPTANIGNQKIVTVLRLAYCLKKRIPYDSLKGLRVWSKSRDSLDVNPDNAMVGTIAEHNQWRALGGRLRGPHRSIIGSKVRDRVGRRFTPEDIREIRASATTERVESEARGCSAALIGYIRRGAMYRQEAAGASIFSLAATL